MPRRAQLNYYELVSHVIFVDEKYNHNNKDCSGSRKNVTEPSSSNLASERRDETHTASSFQHEKRKEKITKVRARIHLNLQTKGLSFPTSES